MTEVHPRPQLARERMLSLDGTWQFQFDDDDAGVGQGLLDRELSGTIVVPFPPESPASGVGDRRHHRALWYRRQFEVPADWHGMRIVLNFGAVDYEADVWVNGFHVVAHEGGHTPFRADITDVLREGSQTLVVRARDSMHSDQPRGKQYWREEPRDVWYDRTSGIWQPVWLEPVPVSHVRSLRWTPDPAEGRVQMEAEVAAGRRTNLHLRVRLTLRGELLSEDTYRVDVSGRLDRTVHLRHPVADVGRGGDFNWSPETPNLVDATVTLLEGDEEVDQVTSYLGMRSVAARGGRLLLNGLPYYCRLVLSQGFWPESHLAAPSGDALRREVELIKQLGFNGVRLHQKVEDPRFLYWCDRLGLIVFAEMPAAYTFTSRAVRRLTHEWLEVLRRDYSHPSVVLWLPFNESWGVPRVASDPQQHSYVQSIYHLTKTLDPSRPVIGNDGWEHVVGDIHGIHDYSLDPEVLRERYGTSDALDRTVREVQPYFRSLRTHGAEIRGEPVMLTEFGGISYAPPKAEEERWFGYGVVKDEAEFIERYEYLLSTVLALRPVSGFCYTQFADVQQETNGLVDEHRRPKLDSARVRKANRRPAASTPGEAVTLAMGPASAGT